MALDLCFVRRVFGCRSSLFVLCAAILSGCGGGSDLALAPVSGKVLKGGKPVAGVSVTFTQTAKNFSAAGRTTDSGAFVLVAQNGKAGAMIGKNKVTLTMPGAGGSTVVNMSDPAQAQKMLQSRDSTLQGGQRGAPTPQAAATTIPSEFSDPNNTPLEYEVKAGSNDFDIPIP
jgi:hypothetical protein